MEGLTRLLNHQINQRTEIRFKLQDYEHKDLSAMLLNCYRAEVIKRNAQFVHDSQTVDKVEKAAKWLMGNNKTGIMLYGNSCGTGKTTLANAMCTLVNYLFDSCYSSDRKSVYRVTAINLAKAYSDNPELYRRYVNQELLFIDDIGTEPVSLKIYGNEFSPITELLYNRYDKQGWTIITSNLSDSQIKERYGERIDDRLKEMFDRMHFQGKSYRK